MTPEDLSSIIGEHQDTSSFISEDTQNKTVDTSIDTSKPYTCDTCGKSFSTNLALIGHKRSHGISKKEKPEVIKASEIMPENLSFLKTSCLKPFGCKGSDNVIQGMMEAPEDLDLLQQLLASNDNAKNIAYITKRYANYIGKPVPSDAGVLVQQKPVSPIESAYNNRLIERLDMARVAQMEKDAYGNQNQKQDSGEISRLTQMISDMQRQQGEQQRQFNEKLVEMQRQYKEDVEKQRTQQEMQSLKDELRSMKEKSDQQIGSLSGTMSEFANSITHIFDKSSQENQFKFDKLLLEMKHEKQTDELKNQLVQAQNSKPMQEKVFDKTTETVDKVIMGTGAVFDKALKSQDALEKANAAMLMKQQGFDTGTINNILNPQNRSSVPSAQAEYENLAKVTQEIEADRAAKQIAQPQIQPEKPPEPSKDAYGNIPIIFNTGE